jgi:fluoroquinolone transport system permease protein
MYVMKLLRGLGPIDARSVGRDSLLRALFVLPIVVAAACRLVLPAVLARLGALLGSDLLAYYSPIVSGALLLIAPVISGQVIGFLLLDQRDDRTLTALQVMPMPLGAYLAYRLAAPMLVSVSMTLAAFPIAGVAVAAPPLLLAALAAAPLAPLFALALAVFAANKVQGLALLKASSVLLAAPIAAAFAPAGWSWAFGAAPTFWPVWLLWSLQAGDPAAWIYLAGGLAYHALLLGALIRRFERVMYQ